jgi:hypothetical protein
MTTQLRWPPSCDDHPAAMTTQLRWPPSCDDHPAAMTTQLRWSPSCVDHPAALTTQLRWPFSCVDHSAALTRSELIQICTRRASLRIKLELPRGIFEELPGGFSKKGTDRLTPFGIVWHPLRDTLTHVRQKWARRYAHCTRNKLIV